MVGNSPTASPITQGDPIRPGILQHLTRAWGSKSGRRALVSAAGLLIVLVIIGIGLVVFSSISRESQSYKDGFSAGGAVYASDSVTQQGAQQACTTTELRGARHGGLPVGDNATQWMKGCVDAFKTAEGGN
jgi:hypothetical protein